MNRAFFIIIIPALLVALGYIVVLRFMGIAPGYLRLVIAMVIFVGAIYWLSRRQAHGEIHAHRNSQKRQQG
jgi:ABC-type spermidine/putrescine transport system permease subunit II